MDWSGLEGRVAALGRATAIGVSVVAEGGARWASGGDAPFPSASTAKIPIMIAVWRMIDAGAAALDDIHRLQAAEKSPGSGVLRYLHAGIDLSLGDLLYLMMAISDNTATNILIDLAGMDRINAIMRELGMTGSILGRPMMGRLAIAGEQENIATPNDYTRVIETLFTGEAASPAACAAMIALLERQQNRRRTGRFVPEADGWRWGSKTGTNTGVVNDAGFVTGPAGRMLIAVYCRGVADTVTGEQIIAEITREAMVAVGLI